MHAERLILSIASPIVSRGEKILKRGCEKAPSQDHAAIELFQRRDKRYPSRPSPAAMNINEFRRTGTDKTWKGSTGLWLVCAWQSGNEINFPPSRRIAVMLYPGNKLFIGSRAAKKTNGKSSFFSLSFSISLSPSLSLSLSLSSISFIDDGSLNCKSLSNFFECFSQPDTRKISIY